MNFGDVRASRRAAGRVARSDGDPNATIAREVDCQIVVSPKLCRSRRFVFNHPHIRDMTEKIEVKVSIPKDDDGFMGRECPEAECEGYFKIKPGTGLTGENLPCHCPYCGYTGHPDRFWTKEQIDYAQSVAFREFSDALVR